MNKRTEAELYPNLFDTPEKQARYEKALAELEPAFAAFHKATEDSTRISAADLAIVINAR